MTLRVSDLSVRLGERRVLHGVDVFAGDGEVVAVVGPNGAGKSTLLRAVAGLLPPSGGHVTVDSVDLSSLSMRGRARRVGFVPQTPHLDQPFTVEEVVAMGRFAHRGRFGWGHDAATDRVAEALRSLRLVALADRPVTALSGGERQRVSLARTLAQDPRVYLLDEPTANLDLGQAAAVHRVMRELAEGGRTVVAVIHDIEAAVRVADRMVLLHEGRVLESGPPRAVVTPRLLAGAFGVQVDVRWSGEDDVRLRVASDTIDDTRN